MRRGSLQRRLAIRLALVYVLAIAMAVSFFIYQAYNTAGSLSDRQLGLRAADLARYVSVANGGVPRLNLPPELAGRLCRCFGRRRVRYPHVRWTGYRRLSGEFRRAGCRVACRDR